jgi:hypothetical protein
LSSIFTDAQVNARREQNLGAPLSGAQHAVLFYFRELTDLLFHGVAVDRDGSLAVVQ